MARRVVLGALLTGALAACSGEPRAEPLEPPVGLSSTIETVEPSPGTPAIEIADPYGARQLVVSGSRPIPAGLELYAEVTCRPVTDCSELTYAIERISRVDGQAPQRQTLYESGADVESPPYVFLTSFVPDASAIALSVCTSGVCAGPAVRDARVGLLVSRDFGASWFPLRDPDGWAYIGGFDVARVPLTRGWGAQTVIAASGAEHRVPPVEGVRGFPWPLRSGGLVWATYGGWLVREDGSTWLDLGLRGDEPLLATIRAVVPSPSGDRYAINWNEEPNPRGTRRPVVYVTVATAEGRILRTFRYDDGVTAVAWANDRTLVANLVASTGEGTPSGLPRSFPLPATIDAVTGETWLLEGPFIDPPRGVQPTTTWRRIQAARRVPDCPVTVANRQTPPGERPSNGHHGNGHIWTAFWPAGIVRFDRGGPGSISADGSLEMKWPWWRAVAGEPFVIEGHRLDGPAAPLEAIIPRGYEQSQFQATSLRFPTAGCWEVTARTAGGSLTFVTLVVGPD